MCNIKDYLLLNSIMYFNSLEEVRKYLRDIESQIKEKLNETKNINNLDSKKFLPYYDIDSLLKESIKLQIIPEYNITSFHIEIINLIIKRINAGKYVAEQKIKINPKLKYLNKNELWDAITYPDIEDNIILKIKEWSDNMSKLFRNYVIPQTKKVQIKYLLENKE